MRRIFVDTNLLVYAVDQSPDDRGDRARQLVTRAMSDGTGVVSTQVLQEFYAVATRKLGIEPAIARRQVELISTMSVVQVTVPLILEAIDLHRLRAISFWDALIVRAALAGGCAELWSEDLQTGSRFEGLVVRDPLAI